MANIKSLCVPTVASCAADLCYLCTSLGITPSIEPCCAAPTPTACFANNYVDGVQSSAITPVSLTPEPIPSNLASGSAGASVSKALNLATSCQSLNSVYGRCAAATPSFAHLPFSQLQSCLCSTDGTYAPSLWDNYFSGCEKYASIVDPSEYSALGAIGGTSLGSRPCERYAEITKTEIGVSSASSISAGAVSSGLVSVSSHGAAGNPYHNCKGDVSVRTRGTWHADTCLHSFRSGRLQLYLSPRFLYSVSYTDGSNLPVGKKLFSSRHTNRTHLNQ